MTAYDMSKEMAIKLISKVSKGEYHYSKLQEMFLSVCRKGWKRFDEFFGEYELNSEGLLAFMFFQKYIDEMLFGLEYATNGRVRYIGTNDIKTFIIE